MTLSPRPIRCLAVVGPTATGKTAFAIELALALGGEVVSIDSRQIYRGFDIGTAKPSAEELARVPHHLVSALPPDAPCTAARYADLAAASIRDIAARGKVPVLAGGTGLYFRALRDGLSPVPAGDPAYRARLSRIAAGGGLPRLRRLLERADPARAASLPPNDTARTLRALELIRASGVTATELYARAPVPPLPLAILAFALTMEREPLYRRIDERVDRMLAAGLLEETRALLRSSPDGAPSPLLATIGYAECAAHLAGEIPLSECVELLKRNTRRFAKRQFTWFRKERDLAWLPVGDPAAFQDAVASARAFLAAREREA